MSERSGGFYTLEMLRGGMRDQYAVKRSYGTVVVEVYLDLGRPIVALRIANADGTRTSTEQAFTHLGDAHREFRRLVRKHP